MHQDTIYVGLDVHSTSISVAIAEPGRGEVRALGTIPNTSDAVVKLAPNRIQAI
jgi:cell division ATPase FtsA